MKKRITILFSFCAFLSFGFLNAQVTNLGFENWSGNDPVGWYSSNDLTTSGGGSQTVFQETTNPAQGSSSIKMVTGSCPDCPTLLLNYGFPCEFPNPFGGGIQLAPSPVSPGIPYTKRPLSVDITYKSKPLNNDAAAFHVTLTKYNPSLGESETVGEAFFEAKSTVTTWTLQNIPVMYYSTDIPDTLNIWASSSVGSVIDCSGAFPGFPDPYSDWGLPYPQAGSEFELDNIIINLPSCNSLQLSISKTDETSFGANDGSATANVSGGASPYQYLWNTGATTQTINGLTPGVYSAAITDVNGCQKTKSVVVSPAGCNISVSTSGTNSNSSSIYNGTGSITLNISGGSTYEVTWNNGVIATGVTGSTTLSNLPVGAYSAIVIDEANPTCANIVSYVVLGPGGSTASVKEINKESDISLYPNPTNNIVKIKYGQVVGMIEIYSMLGVKLYENKFNNSEVIIDIENVAKKSGHYLLKIYDEKGIIVGNKKIIYQK